jgi:hypothetical protein
MTTLFDSRLSVRDFGSDLLHVGDLQEWAKSKRLQLQTTPAIDGFEFVQVEALLCAIERPMQDLTPEQAAEIVLNHPVLKNDPAVTRYPDDVDPTTCRWLLGANAHKRWRDLLSVAIQSHELALLDFASKLPIDTAPAQTATTPAPVSDVEWVQLAQTKAREYIKQQRDRNLYPSQEAIGDRIATEFRKAGIVGIDGKPLKGSYIKRHALKGISSATAKKLSTTIGRGK